MQINLVIGSSFYFILNLILYRTFRQHMKENVLSIIFVASCFMAHRLSEKLQDKAANSFK